MAILPVRRVVVFALMNGFGDEMMQSPYAKAIPPYNRRRPGLLQQGNIIDLYNRPATQNPGGGYSTTRSMSFGLNGNEVLVPTVVGGRQMTDQEAMDRYRQTGENLGVFANPM